MLATKFCFLAILASSSAQLLGGTAFNGGSALGTNAFGTNALGTRSNSVNRHFGASRVGLGLGGSSDLNNFNAVGLGPHNQLGRFGGSPLTTAEANAIVINGRSENDGLGVYNFGFQTDSGITREESGRPTPLGNAVTGSYSYTSPEGIEVIVNYIADENGFRVDSPNVPPTPRHALEQIAAANQAKQLGLLDNAGNRLDGFRGVGGVRGSNLHNLVNQRRNPLFNIGGQGVGLDGLGFQQEQLLLNQNQFGRFGNLPGTGVIGNQLLASNQLLGQQFNRHGLNGFSTLGDNRFNQFQDSRFRSPLLNNNQAFGTSFLDRSGSRFGRRGQFAQPSFQNRALSRFSVEEGGPFALALRQDTPIDNGDGTAIKSTANSNVASYRVSS